ncbi:MAG: hypothetical protein K9N52_00535 [Verrucomicrobia bacterium]|nr:hypothetical protein [Verrucomicrobiota bacterium]
MKKTEVHRSETLTGWAINISDQQLFVTIAFENTPQSSKYQSSEAYCVIKDFLGTNWIPIQERVYGKIDACKQVEESRRHAYNNLSLQYKPPITFVEGAPLHGTGLAGIQLMAVNKSFPDNLSTITYKNKEYGVQFNTPCARYIWLQDIHGKIGVSLKNNDRAAQASRMFHNAFDILKEYNADYRNVVRTWIYIDDILDWYNEFNIARNRAYNEFGLMNSENTGIEHRRIHLPASTGIQGKNLARSACVMDLLAIIPESSDCMLINQLSNEKQKDAFLYGSAFSRGASVKNAWTHQLLLSGTASIDESGRTICIGDFEGQVQRTFDNVDCLLNDTGKVFSDICSATLFIKRPNDAAALEKIIKARDLDRIPAIKIHADVCRSDLLFEMDGAAAKAVKPDK